MNLFGRYIPADSWVDRLGVGWKYLLVLLLTLPALLLASPLPSLAALAAAMLVLLSARVGWRTAFALPTAVLILIVVLAGYQALSGAPLVGLVVSVNLIAAIYASRILTLTTPGTVLIDALVRALQPLRWLRIDPDLVGLAIAVMLRSIPVLLDSFAEVRLAARARGRERNLFALITPVVVRAVGHAQAVGTALAARGLGEP